MQTAIANLSRKRSTGWSRLPGVLFIVLLFLNFAPFHAAGADSVQRKIRIVLVGDSTVTDGSGWGYGFKQFLTDQVECINTAQNGRSSKSFINEGHWQEGLAEQGDYYLIQFGHNDQPGKGPDRETDPQTTYTEFMTRYVEEARAIGATPILVTSLTRRIFNKVNPGRIASTLGSYVEAVKQIAADQKVPLIDLHARSIALCERLGPEKTHGFDLPRTEGGFDTTHLDSTGSVAFARLVVEALREAVPALAAYLRDEPIAASSEISSSVAVASEAQPLNVLFCFADDWGRYASAYAKVDGRPSLNDVIRTSHIDRVAEEGVLFRNAFAPAPSCTPCRSALLSGRYWWSTGRGAILRGAVWDSAIPSFPLRLRDAGYHIGKSYKVWSPGTPVDAPFGQQQFAYEKAGRAANNFSENVTRWMSEGTALDEAKERILTQVRENFDAFLADRKPGQPWFYWFGTTPTHRRWIKGSGQKLWGIDPDSLRGKLPKFLPDVPEVREDVADYLGECQAFDAYVGVLLEQLEASGELNRTVVVISGDHGMPGVPGGKCDLYDLGAAVGLVVRWPGGTADRVVDDFVNLMDLAPTFLEIGGASVPNGVHGRNLVELFQSSKSGQVDPTRTFVVTGRERHVGSAREGNLPYPMRAIRTADFLYIRNFAPDRWPMGAPYAVTENATPPARELETTTRIAFPDLDAGPTKAWLIAHRNDAKWKPFYDRAFGKRPAEELYDLRNDPEQQRNVASNPAFAARKEELSGQLMEVLTSTGDPRVTGDGTTFDKSPFSDPE